MGKLVRSNIPWHAKFSLAARPKVSSFYTPPPPFPPADLSNINKCILLICKINISIGHPVCWLRCNGLVIKYLLLEFEF